MTEEKKEPKYAGAVILPPQPGIVGGMNVSDFNSLSHPGVHRDDVARFDQMMDSIKTVPFWKWVSGFMGREPTKTEQDSITLNFTVMFIAQLANQRSLLTHTSSHHNAP